MKSSDIQFRFPCTGAIDKGLIVYMLPRFIICSVEAAVSTNKLIHCTVFKLLPGMKT